MTLICCGFARYRSDVNIKTAQSYIMIRMKSQRILRFCVEKIHGGLKSELL